MPWWSWIVIWVGLVLILVAVLALIARSLFRKLMALQAELDELSALLEALEQRADELVTATAPVHSAILRGRDEISAERRSLRRVLDRKKAARREARLDRGRMLITADPMRYASIARRK